MLDSNSKTLWNTDSSQWSKLPCFEQEISLEFAAQLVDQVSRHITVDDVEQRTKPYRTPVTVEELRLIIK